MNESFEEIQLSLSVVDSFVEKVKGIQTNLASSKQEFASSWEGSTRVHLDEAITLEDTKLEELLARLASMKNLLSLIEQHNATRKRREQLYADIRNLEGQLYYTVYDEETGESHQEERPGIRDSINRKRGEVEEANRLLDQLVQEIDQVTSS